MIGLGTSFPEATICTKENGPKGNANPRESWVKDHVTAEFFGGRPTI